MSRPPDNKIPVDQSDRPNLWENWFEDSPIPMTFEDWSEVKRIVVRLRNSGVGSISEYIGDHPEMLAELAPAAKILDANSAAISVYKATSKQELLEAFNALPDLGSYNPTTGLSNIYVTLVERFSAGETRIVLEGPDTTLDGSIIYIRTTTSIGRGYENDWGRVLQTVEDITEQKRAQMALEESEALLTQSAAIANLGYAVWDRVGEKYITVSDEWAGIFHYTKEEFIATFTTLEEDFELIHPEDRDRYSAYYYDPDLGHQAPDIEYRIVRRDGGIRHVHQRYKQVFDASGRATQSLVSIQDITARKLAEEALRKSHALYNQAELMGKLGHWTWDHMNSRMDSCSDQFARIYEMTTPEATAYFSDLESELSVVHTDDRERYEQALRDSEEQLKGVDIEYRIITRSGAVRHVHQRSELVLDGQNRITASFGTVQDITERKKLSEEIAHQASHDALTGLINRSEFERRLGRVLDTARKWGDEHALCYLDLDQFKVINDTCGHMAGDELLRQLGQLLSASVRKRDTLARLGGDEFGVLMEHCTLAHARRVANKVCRAVTEFRFIWEERVFRIGVSIGLVSITETSGSVANLLSAADNACYAAKDEGRNRVHVHHHDDTDLARRRGEMRWVARIDQALEDERLQLWSQPIVPAMAGSSGEGEDFELLLRLVDERGDTILPGVFLTAAEHYGLLTKLDRWVIGTALGWLSRDPKLLERLHLCFINLSGTSLTDEEFLEFLYEQFEKSQVPPQKICFEITETAAIANLSRAMTFMGALKGQGCRFALDDFGSGLSSFAYLKSLPVDYVKIDGTFVKDIVDDEVNLALVRSINDVAKVMGKWTIAESVENEAILEKLREIGVDYVQGSGIGHPAPIEEATFSRLQSLERPG